jgi:putative PIN family toxin of toxin-antitoxin system
VRLVLDTNTALSGLLWGGAPGRVIDAAVDGRVALASSEKLLAELQGVLGRAKFARQLSMRGVPASDLVSGYASLVTMVDPAGMGPRIASDPDDDHVLAAAVAAEADAIVSGDAHLLNLKRFHAIEIVTAALIVRRLDPRAD